MSGNSAVVTFTRIIVVLYHCCGNLPYHMLYITTTSESLSDKCGTSSAVKLETMGSEIQVPPVAATVSEDRRGFK